MVENTVNGGGCVPLVVTGNSMAPFMKDGRDTVWLKKCTEADYKKGKILLFRRADGKMVLHRVIKVNSLGVLTMNGDAQFWCEDIKKEQALAVVSHIERNGRRRSCGSMIYKTKIAIWQALKPLRPLLFRVQRKIKRMLGR